MTTELSRMVTYLGELLPIKTHKAFIARSCKVRWQTKANISLLAQCLWPESLLQSQTKLMKQCQEAKQNWTGRDTLKSLFAQIFDCQGPNFFLEERVGTRLCLHTFLSFSHNFRICEATCIQCFLHQISCTTLLVMNRTTLQSSNVS